MNVAPLPGAGRGRVAEHAAPAAGGQRHQRHEGRRQRRAQPQHPRRLVGRGRLAATPAGPSASGEDYDDLDYQDDVEAGALYDLLENEIVPLFYDRGADGLPRGWIAQMKSAMRKLCPVFNTNRMVHEYTRRRPTARADARARGSRRTTSAARAICARWKAVGAAGVERTCGSSRVETRAAAADHRGRRASRCAPGCALGGLSPADLAVAGLHRAGSAREPRHRRAARHPDDGHGRADGRRARCSASTFTCRRAARTA